ncbi:MAG: ATPase family protein, partial [Candidatus Dependentiae bacterium]|nr:ATPase family protein [Candidatus Dependentiae bacterium]
EASEYWHSNEYYGRRKKRIAIFRAAKRLYELEKALKEQRAYLADMRGRIALEREATAAEAANKKALSLADVEGQLAVAEANRKAKEEEDKAKQERIKDKGKVIVDQIKAQGDASAQIATIQQPTLLAQHKETVAADKLKHDATLLADKEQQEARLKARKSLVQYAIPALTIATILGISGYFAIRHYYQPRPTTIERADTSMLSRLDKWRGFKVPASNLDAVILEPSLAQQVIGKFAGIVLAIQKGFPLSNMLFYGPPGTGKTMAAQAFARRLHEQGIANHVIIRGPAFKRLGSPAKAQEALANILRWASKSKLPVILVFDEAETMFADRDSNFANEMTNDLTTTMLSFFERGIHEKMMFILSTNYPDRIDKALLNRIDGSNRVAFTVPGQKERESLLDNYLKQHLIDRGLSVSDEIRREKALLAQKMDGLVGRQIDSLVAQTIYAMLNKGNSMLDLQTLEVAVENARRSLQHGQLVEPLVG